MHSPVEVEQVVEVVVGPHVGGVGPSAFKARGEGVVALALLAGGCSRQTTSRESNQLSWRVYVVGGVETQMLTWSHMRKGHDAVAFHSTQQSPVL